MSPTSTLVFAPDRPPASSTSAAARGGRRSRSPEGYPLVRVDGLDLDPVSVETARANAEARGVGNRVAFHASDAASPRLPGGYDLVVAIEALHDMPRPVEALSAMRRLAAPSGTVLVVEEKVEETFFLLTSPNDRLNYGWSVLTCLPSAMCGPGAAGTGTLPRRETLLGYARQSGFSSVENTGVPHDA